MGKSSVSQPHVVPPGSGAGGSASREVFQGLFRDLGKQAMALEAILRAVCGRVDKVESWLTEVSYGMTELDLKLRNIAHNIDGAATVDEESHGPRRWAIPPADDAKPTATTMSKRFGSDKKAVRVTGMAANILERLSAVDERASVVAAPIDDRAKSDKSDKPDKSVGKKKKKHDGDAGKKHHAKKPKAGGAEVAVAAAVVAAAEDIPAQEVQLPHPTEVLDNSPVPNEEETSPAAVLEEMSPLADPPVASTTLEAAPEEEDTNQDEPQKADEDLVEEVEAKDPKESIPSTPTVDDTSGKPQSKAEPVHGSSENEDETPPEISAPEAPQAQMGVELEPTEPSPADPAPTSPRSSRHSEADEPAMPQAIDHSTDHSGASSAEASPDVSAREQGENNDPKEEAARDQEEAQATMEEVVSLASGAASSSPREQQELESTLVMQEATAEPVVAVPEAPLIHSEVDTIENPADVITPLPTTAVESAEVGQAEPKAIEENMNNEPDATPVPPVEKVASQAIPAMTTEYKTEPAVPISSLQVQAAASTIKNKQATAAAAAPAPAERTAKAVAAVASESKPATLVAPPVQPATMTSSKPEQLIEAPKTVPKDLKTVESSLDQNTPAPAKPVGPVAPLSATDPLMSKSRRSSNKRLSKSSNSSTKKVDTDSTPQSRRSSANKRGSESRRSSFSSAVGKQSKPKSKQELAVVETTAPPATTTPAATATPATKDASASEEESIEGSSSGHSASSSSEDGDGGKEEESDGDQDEGESGNEEEHEGGEGEQDEDEESAVDGSMSRTITALKKLKKANMLTPEEEEELKQRAHKKWFQLKGHIKEKQKKDVANILLKRKKNVFTVSSRIELLEEKSREIYAALKQITHELHDKADGAAHETLRRHARDIEQSLQAIDARLAIMSSPTMAKTDKLQFEVGELRTAMQFQLSAARDDAVVRHAQLEAALAEQRVLVETMAQDIPAKLRAQADLFGEQLKQLPDHSAALESLRRTLRRKADLKLLKELEARLLGLDADGEDCLVRCLSCRKEVLNLHSDTEVVQVDDQQDVSAGGQLRKVNPGPSAPRIYRSTVPFSAQPFVQGTILEEPGADVPSVLQQHQPVPLQQQQPVPIVQEPQQSPPLVQQPPTQQQQHQQQQQSAGDSYMSEKPPAVRAPPVARWSTPAAEIRLTVQREAKTPRVAPISLMSITATRATLSPDRPISAPVVAPKKKPATPIGAKSQPKSRPSMLQEPPQ